MPQTTPATTPFPKREIQPPPKRNKNHRERNNKRNKTRNYTEKLKNLLRIAQPEQLDK
jgi:hypothetical protein